MKKVCVVLFVLLFTFTCISLASNIPRVEQPKVFFNTNCILPETLATNGGMEAFAHRLKKEGYNVNHGLHKHLDAKFLAGIDVLILTDPRYVYTDEDISNLRAYIKNGGGLLYISGRGLIYSAPEGADIAPAIGLPDSNNLGFLIEEFGINLGSVSQISSKYRAEIDQNSPISQPYTCKTIGMDYDAFFTPNAGGRDIRNGFFSVGQVQKLIITSDVAQAVATGRNGIVAAISTDKAIGKGRMAVVGTENFFFEGLYWMRDNEEFGLNLINYLLGRFDLRATTCRFFYGTRNVQGGSTFPLYGKVKNVGSTFSNAVSVAFYLTDDGTLSSPPKTAGAMLTVMVPVLLPGDVYEINTEGTLPKDLPAGEYRLHMVIDPDGTSNDSNAGNNARMARKVVDVH